MISKYLIYPYIEFNSSMVKNSTYLSILPDIPEKYLTNEYILLKEVAEDTRIESLSYELYGTMDYWDLLMLLNGMTDTSSLPVNYDIILSRTEYELDKWYKTVAKLGSRYDLTPQYNEIKGLLRDNKRIVVESDNDIIKKQYLALLDMEKQKNEKFKQIKYMSQTHMSELEKDLHILSQNEKINKELVIRTTDV